MRKLSYICGKTLSVSVGGWVCSRLCTHTRTHSFSISQTLFIVTKRTAPRMLIQQLISHLIYYVNEIGKQFPVSHRYRKHERYRMNSLESHAVRSIQTHLFQWEELMPSGLLVDGK